MSEIVGNRVRHPFNALDTLKEIMTERLEIDMEWWQSEYCDKTFILILYLEREEVELNVKFYPETYAVSASNNCSDALLNMMVEKLDTCIHY
jgi:hypothetical protein